uniref:Uncharacterized protein n=1 Tax=Musa acuminata subsp. malaccensis TaxID=214687 RepID=A0A804I2R9_MUSAM
MIIHKQNPQVINLPVLKATTLMYSMHLSLWHIILFCLKDKVQL